MKKKQSRTDNEVIIGNRASFKNNRRQPGITGMGFWESMFPSSQHHNDVEEILKFPGTDDMAGVFARGFFKDDDQRLATVILSHMNKIFHDDSHQELLRAEVASTIGMKALGKILQIQSDNKVLAPGVLREVIGMKEAKGPEATSHNSDFRDDGNNGNHGEANQE